jgi:hypothetical protein
VPSNTASTAAFGDRPAIAQRLDVGLGAVTGENGERGLLPGQHGGEARLVALLRRNLGHAGVDIVDLAGSLQRPMARLDLLDNLLDLAIVETAAGDLADLDFAACGDARAVAHRCHYSAAFIRQDAAAW